ncbi:type II secretion system protein N [Aquipseudomonas alcaligenes]|uniref:type II secretion system protein N n=1 Tax=Aquipseudomonas alcaligenes TaxID=43263 RepID=UPI00374A1965
MSAISIRLPAWLQRHGVTGLCLLVVLLITLSLTQQSVDLLRFLRSEAPSEPTSSASNERQPVSLQRLQYLFGTPALPPGSAQNAPPTKQQMTLLASFVNPDPQRSTAIIQIAGDKPKRVAVGAEVNASTRLHAVHKDHVVLDRGGNEESLRFPAIRQSSLTPHFAPSDNAPMEPTAEQLEQLQDEDVRALQERIQNLQQRMEGDGDMPQPDALEVEESP